MNCPVPAAPAHAAADAGSLDLAWALHNQQEDKEPIDAALELAGGLRPRHLDSDRRMELKVQAHANLAKTRSENLGSTKGGYLSIAALRIPRDAAAYCRSRYADGRTSLLLKWHYCLVLHLATGRSEWLARAIALMLQSADGTADDRRASSYIITAYNLDRWYGCGLRDAVLASALRFIRGRPHNVFTYKCAYVVANLARDSSTLDEMLDAMIRAAHVADGLDAIHCLRAASLLAGVTRERAARPPLPPRRWAAP